jgi:hypothetical protein
MLAQRLLGSDRQRERLARVQGRAEQGPLCPRRNRRKVGALARTDSGLGEKPAPEGLSPGSARTLP